MDTAAPNIIIPRYRNESFSFQRSLDWMFRSEDEFKEWKKKMMARDQVAKLKIAQNEQSMQRKTVDELGQVTARYPLNSYMYWHLTRRGCWDNKQFRDEFKRDNPEVRAVRPQQKTFMLGSIKE